MAIGPGHGVEISYEPTDALGTWVPVAHLIGDVGQVFMNDAIEALEHNLDVNTFHEAGIHKTEEVPININLDKTNATHTELETYYHNMTHFRLRVLGRGGSAGNDETIFSDGWLTRWEDRSPLGGPTRTVVSSYRPTGTYTRNGVVYGL